MPHIQWLTIGIFVAIVAIALVLDLYLHRQNQEPTLKDSGTWSLIWVALSLAFAGVLYFQYGHEAASLFLSGYVLEKALSVDNLLVFTLVFQYFGVPSNFQHRILYLGVAGAIVFRMLFVVVGVGFLKLIGPWALAVFGLFVGYSAYKMLTAGDDDGEPVDHSSRWYIKWTKNIFPVTTDTSRNVFFQMESNVRKATVFLLCAVSLEITDVMFSFDSVPVVISVTRQPVLIYTAMIFAIMGLRSMYFVLEVLKRYLTKLGTAVAVLLAFIAIKLEVNAFTKYDIPPMVNLGIVVGILAVGVIASLMSKEDVATE